MNLMSKLASQVGLALFTMLGTTASHAQGTPAGGGPPGTLQVHATGFRHTAGHAVAKLYRPGENVLSRTAYRVASATIREGQATMIFPNVPTGAYAVVVFHDENDNGEIDHRFGFPSEPLGFSNHFSLNLFSRKPTFEKLRFEFQATAGTPPEPLEIKLK